MIKKSNKQKTNETLDALPESSHKFWRGAEVNKITLRSAPKCSHYFIRRSGREVECRNCHAGFFLTPNWDVKEGHLYVDNKLVL